MSPAKLLLLLGGIAVTIVTASLVVQKQQVANTLPIPMLDLSVAPSQANSPLVGLLVQGDRYIWSASDTANGITMKGSPGAQSWHNFTTCAVGGPLLGPQIASDTQTRFWGYEYVGDEASRQTAGFRGRELFRGRFFVSQGERNAGTPGDRYDYLFHSVTNPNDQTLQQSGIQAGKTYYWMLERDIFYRCNVGLEYACGNGTREGNEQCDDGNTASGDGCSSSCQTEGTSSSSSSTTSSSSSSSSSSDSSSSSTSSQSSDASSSSASSISSSAGSSSSTGNSSSDASSSSQGGSGGSSSSTANSSSEASSQSSEASSASSEQSSVVSSSSSQTSLSSASSLSSSIASSSSVASSSSSVALSSSSVIASSSSQASTTSSGGSSSQATSSSSVATSSVASSSSQVSTSSTSASGGSSSTAQSSSSSIPTAVCGNGLVQIGEECDDANLTNGDGCSTQCVEEPNFYCSGEPSVCQFLIPGLPNISLRIDIKNIGATASATAGQQGISLLRFDATAGAVSGGIRMVNLALEATQGSLANITNFTLWVDANGDNTIDTNLLTGSLSGNLIRFAAPANFPALAANQTRAFEVRADVAPTLTGNPAQVEVSVAFNAPDAIQARTVTTSTMLRGVRINSNPCTSPICEMFVSTANSPLWTFTYPQSSSSSLAAANCGNGTPESGEQCDDGNTNNNDACVIDVAQSYECKVAVCGDGYLWNQGGGTEECDDSNTLDGDGCFSNCILMIPPDNLP